MRQECFIQVKQVLKNDSIPINLRSKLLVQGAAIIFDIKTGSVLGMLGGRLEDQYHDFFNRATKAKRQPGSIFKPFVYLSAIKEGHSPYTKLKNQAIKIWDKSEFWEPENWNNEVGGIYTLRQGLYEFKEGETLENLLDFGGRLKPNSRIELSRIDTSTGKRNISIVNINKIADALNISLTNLFDSDKF